MWNSELGSKPLVTQIIYTIKQSAKQAISFRDYMNMCLYHPQYGYYMNERVKVGKQGDYYTSSAIGSVMGEMLLRHIVRLKEEQTSMKAQDLCITEWGGGTGVLAKHMLDEARAVFPSWYEVIQFTVIEHSPYHRQQQQETLAEHLSHVHFMSAEEWLESGSHEEDFVVSNELLDAFPVDRIRCVQGHIHEIYVAWNEQEQCFYETLIKVEDGPLRHYIEQENIRLHEGQTAEVNLHAGQWIAQIGKWMTNGYLITIDYGDIAAEIYAEHRMNGTLVCYRQHQSNDQPYTYVGEQDMTSHVNFSAVIRSGKAAGFAAYSLQTQKQFLVEAGILEQLQNHDVLDPFHPIARKNRSIRQLLLSDQMSELFKVLVQRKKAGE